MLGGRAAVAVVEDGGLVTGDDLDVWERRLEEQVESDITVTETDREAIVRARVGQGLFKQRVMQIETSCRITGVSNLSQLSPHAATRRKKSEARWESPASHSKSF